MKRIHHIVLGAALATAPLSLSAQAGPVIKLKPVVGKIADEFSSIVAVRELADGRVLVTDVTESKLVVADFTTGAATQIGRTGQGPGEYQNPSLLLRLGGDSTLLVERRTQRWHFLAGAVITSSVPADNAVYQAMNRQVIGADGRGHFIRTISWVEQKAGVLPTAAPESSWVVRVRRATARADSIAVIKAPKSVITSETDAKGAITSVSIFRPPYAVGDELAMFEDGWIAIARRDAYRIDWLSPDGKLTRGPALPWPRTRITRADIEKYFGGRSSSTAPTPAQQAALQKSIDNGLRNAPEFMPPFDVGGAMAMGDGQLLVRHPATAVSPTARYDVVDRSGKLRGTIAMAKGETIAAISRNWAYVVSMDDDGLQYLSRHPWP